MQTPDLALRIDILYEALGRTRRTLPSSMPVTRSMEPDGRVTLQSDFSAGSSETALRIDLSSLIASIGCIRDYLDDWLVQNGRDKIATRVLKNNRDASIIMDIYNRDKHPKYTHSHSGIFPVYRRVRRLVGTQKKLVMILDPRESRMRRSIGSGFLVITADVFDQNENFLGRVDEIAGRAIRCWEGAFADVGVPHPRARVVYKDMLR